MYNNNANNNISDTYLKLVNKIINNNNYVHRISIIIYNIIIFHLYKY